MIISGANLLEQNREWIDSLNVFPVPDGDTGTNMSLTMKSTVQEIAAKDEHDASKMLSGNFTAFLTHFYDKEAKEFKVNMQDEIMRGCLLTQGGKIIHERFKEA